MNVSARVLAGAAAALTVAAPLAAQGTAPAAAPAACPAEQSTGPLAIVSLTLTKATSATKPEDRAKNLREAVKRLTEKPADFKANEPGRQLALGRTLMTYAEGMPGPTYVLKRADAGFTDNKDATVDLLAAADSAFTAVERSAPGCVQTVAAYRSQQPWVKLINSAVQAVNAQQADSAELFAKQSLVVNRANPYAYVVLANVGRVRKNEAAIVENSRKIIELAGTDTTYNEVRRQAYVDVGYYLSEQAKNAPADQKAAMTAESRKALQAYLTEAPNGPQAAAVQAQLAQLLVASGDTAAIASSYQPMLANPAQYSDLALAQAAVTAERTKKVPDAIKLYQASLAKNPNFRDVLYNLASAYYDTKQFDSMPAVLTKLVALDPNNPDNYLLHAYYHQGKMNAATAARTKKLHTDSLVAYNQKSKTAPVAVKMTGFNRGEAKSTLNGTVENRGTAAKPFVVTVEFLDATGKVVATQRADVGSVAPKQSKPFSVSADAPGVVAYRYAPVS